MPEAVSQQMKIQINRTVVHLIKDDVTDLDVDAFVFHAQSDLSLGSGFGNAIAVRGGPEVQQELNNLGPVPTGEAVVSTGGNLKASFVIHAVGPTFQEEDFDHKLRVTIESALRRAEEKAVTHIAFPAMGAGYYGQTPAQSANVMVDTLKTYLGGETGIKELTICVLDTPQYEAFQAQLSTLG